MKILENFPLFPQIIHLKQTKASRTNTPIIIFYENQVGIRYFCFHLFVFINMFMYFCMNFLFTCMKSKFLTPIWSFWRISLGVNWPSLLSCFLLENNLRKKGNLPHILMKDLFLLQVVLDHLKVFYQTRPCTGICCSHLVETDSAVQ